MTLIEAVAGWKTVMECIIQKRPDSVGAIPPGDLHAIENQWRAGTDVSGISFRKYLVFADPPAPAWRGPLVVYDSDGEPFYPIAGAWQGWYWSDEITAARALGWRCDPYEGWCWNE